MSKIVFQGEMGAYGHQACINYLEQNNLTNFEIINTNSFEKALNLVESNIAQIAVIPIENSKAGRVTDVHNLLSKTDLNIIDEIFLPVKHNLWILPDAQLSDIKTVTSHPQALMQCEGLINKYNLTPISHADTAGACLKVQQSNDKTLAAIGSKAAGSLYNLQLAAENIADDPTNTTRFVVFSKSNNSINTDNLMSSILLTVKHEPSSLYNLLGIFAQENINLLRLESYMNDGSFKNSTFYVELDGNAHVLLANKISNIQDLTSNFKIIGTYNKQKTR